MRTSCLLTAGALLAVAHAGARDIGELRPLAVIKVGATADWVAPADDAVWVGSTGPDAVQRVDPAENRITDRIGLPGEPCAGLALGFGSLWVPLCPRAAGAPASLARVDLASRRLLAVYPTGVAAAEGGIAISGGSVWLLTDAEGTLAGLDPATGQLRHTVHVPAGSYNPHDADGALWVTQAGGTHVTRIDPLSGAVAAPLTVGAQPRFLTSGAGALWILQQGDGRVARVDLSTFSIEHIALHTPGHGGDIAYAEGYVWSTMPKTPLSLIDAASHRLLCQWRGAGGDSLGVKFGAVWLTDYHRGTLSRLDRAEALRRCQSPPRALHGG